jgi:hypothetical protein
MQKYIKVMKPGTTKSQLVEAEKVDFYRQYGWEPAVVEVVAKLRPPKKTAQPEPAVDATASVEVVGTDDNKGE